MIGMHGTKEAVTSLAGLVKPADIAAGLGVTPGRISQIFAENPELKALAAPPASAEAVQLTELQDSLELKLLRKFEEKVEMSAFMMKPLELLKAAAIVNNMKRRAGGPAGFGDGSAGTIINQQFVKLDLPAPRQAGLVMSQRGEIIEAGGRTLVSASKEQVAAALIDNIGEVQDYDARRKIKASQGNIELLSDNSADSAAESQDI